MPTLDEEIYEILKICMPDGYEEENIRGKAKDSYPVRHQVSKEDTLLLFKCWTCYKETAVSNWRTIRYKDNISPVYSDKGLDFDDMVSDMERSKQFIRNSIKEGVTFNLLQARFFNDFTCNEKYAGLDSNKAAIIEYSRYVIASAAAWESFQTSDLSKDRTEDYLKRQKMLHDVMADCGQPIYDKFRAILEETKKRIVMIKQGTIPKRAEIKTDAEMIEALEACTSKAKEWQKEMEKLKAENEQKVAGLQAENARLRKENEELKNKLNNDMYEYYNFDRLVETIKKRYKNNDEAKQAFELMRDMRKGCRNKDVSQKVMDAMDDVEKYFNEKEEQAKKNNSTTQGGIHIGQLNIGNGTQGSQLALPENNK